MRFKLLSRLISISESMLSLLIITRFSSSPVNWISFDWPMLTAVAGKVLPLRDNWRNGDGGELSVGGRGVLGEVSVKNPFCTTGAGRDRICGS